jgi:hypothetical protein
LIHNAVQQPRGFGSKRTQGVSRTWLSPFDHLGGNRLKSGRIFQAPPCFDHRPQGHELFNNSAWVKVV